MAAEDVIAKYLQGDATDLTNSQVTELVNAYPNKYSTSADVPNWIKKSLKGMLVPSGTTSEFTRRVVAVPGLTNTNASPDIQIYTMSYESAEKNVYNKIDEPGSQTDVVRIFVRQNGDTIPTSGLVRDVTNRIKFLINHSIRLKRSRGVIDQYGGITLLPTKLPTGEGIDLPIPKGYGIDPEMDCKCFWVGAEVIENTTGIISVYRCVSTTIF